MLSDPVVEAFGLIHRHPSGENFWYGYGSWMSCSWLNRLRLRAVTITNFRWIVTDSSDEPRVNHNGDLKSVTWLHKKALGHLLKHHRPRFAKLKLTSEMSDTSFFDVFYGQFTIAVGQKLCCTHSCVFLNFISNFFTVTLNYQLSCIKKVLAILFHSLSSFITGFITSYPLLFHLLSKIF